MPRIAVKDVEKCRRIWKGISPDERDQNSRFQAFNAKTPLINVLIQGVNEGKIKAYADGVPLYTTPLTSEEFAAVTKKISGNKNIKYVVKEDSLILKTGEVTSFMLGLSVVVSTTAADGTVKDETLFCLFYPDCRNYLAETPVIGNDTWYDIFEQHAYTAKVEKVSTDSWLNKG